MYARCFKSKAAKDGSWHPSNNSAYGSQQLSLVSTMDGKHSSNWFVSFLRKTPEIDMPAITNTLRRFQFIPWTVLTISITATILVQAVGL